WVSAGVEPGRLLAGVDEQLVGVDPQAGGQLVKGAGVGTGLAAKNAADRPLVEPGGVDHVDQREPLANHDAAHVLAIDGPARHPGRRGGSGGSLSHRPSAWILGVWAGGIAM